MRQCIPGINPSDAIVGLVGMGAIAKEVAKRLNGFGVREITYYSRTRLSQKEEEARNLTYCQSLDDLLRKSDVVSLHVPLTAETRHLLGKNEFAKCKKGARIVNTAR